MTEISMETVFELDVKDVVLHPAAKVADDMRSVTYS